MLSIWTSLKICRLVELTLLPEGFSHSFKFQENSCICRVVGQTPQKVTFISNPQKINTFKVSIINHVSMTYKPHVRPPP